MGWFNHQLDIHHIYMIYDIWFLIYDIWYLIWVFRHHLKKSSRRKTWLLNNKQKSPLLTHRLKMTTCLLFEEGGLSVVSQFVNDLRGAAGIRHPAGFGWIRDWWPIELEGSGGFQWSDALQRDLGWPKMGWVGLGWLLQTQITSHLTWFPGSYWIMQYPMNLYM